jgi:hypothetical protein
MYLKQRCSISRCRWGRRGWCRGDEGYTVLVSPEYRNIVDILIHPLSSHSIDAVDIVVFHHFGGGG